MTPAEPAAPADELARDLLRVLVRLTYSTKAHPWTDDDEAAFDRTVAAACEALGVRVDEDRGEVVGARR